MQRDMDLELFDASEISKLFCSTVVGLPAKIKKDMIVSTPNFAALRLHEICWKDAYSSVMMRKSEERKDLKEDCLTHWGRVIDICVSKLTIIV